MMECYGKVDSFHLTADKVRYTVVKFKNAENLNFRLFVPDPQSVYVIGQKVKVNVEPTIDPALPTQFS